jgi:SAM-dependent methyltransferase
MNQTEYHAQNITYDAGNSYEKVKRLLDFEHGPKLRILDVGSGSGLLGEKLLSFGHIVTGLDVNKSAADRVWVKMCDITRPWPVDAQSFDMVICTDVAEHLERPEYILTEARRVLKSNGVLIFGVPNHFDIRQRLLQLFGKGIVHWDNLRHGQTAWSYAHLRFFTLPDLHQFFHQYGWTIIESQFNFMGAGIVPNRLPNFIKLWLLRLWPNLFSGKFIFLLKLKHSVYRDDESKIFIPGTPPGL